MGERAIRRAYSRAAGGTGHWARVLAAAGLVLGILALVLLAPATLSAQADEMSFDPSEFEKAPWRLGGFAEADASLLTMNRNGALYHLTFPQWQQPRLLHQYAAKLQLEGGYTWPWLAFHFRWQATGTRDELGSDARGVLQEATLSAKPTPASTAELGKRVARWGKGYAWNPVAFVDRPKDPNDPDLSQEGFVMAHVEVIRSFEGDLRNAALTLVLLPVSAELNTDFGAERAWNVAGKLTLLLWDTDVDLLALGGGTRSSRYGMDFSRNLGSNVELHGEWARISDAPRQVLLPDGRVQTHGGPADSWLLGVRYLTEFELTTIAEYYFNGAGYTRDELESYFRYVERAWQQAQDSGVRGPLDKAAALLQGAYGRSNPGLHYGYLRLSQKDPFGWLYVSPGAIALANLDDQSRMLTAELTYTGITNLEFRARLIWLQGERFTEFGAKPNAQRAELRLQWSF